ncbi:DUF2637 domain-containing protein [Nocardiopsis sp. L17-MgMaSL7]|uniref:DUF2637 domain-containing protein n=1 Tax=Nocardiopsis sp. L17-MgMaSL7 TaxID=1938893 RepID=UPI000D714840|nr:DUF2637 domain-containing protein [Nocardiopsis sp. L17-MgMaSL7]PWV49214.1 uncharacterized protein DUF2637 [Nocardiopsis sp. L17-MgMaSL7]
MKRGNLIAWLAFITGAVVSVGANVLHALEGDGPTDLGRLIAAGWAPVALLLVAELVARARQSGPKWIIALRWFGTAVVAGVAAVVSYGHMRDLLLSYGESHLVAHLLPLSVDGLLLVASLALATPAEGQTAVARHEEHERAGGTHSARTPAAPTEGERFVHPAAPAPVSAASGTSGTRDMVTVPLDDAHGGADEPAEESGDDRARARQAYRAARAEGVPLTGKELAARFGRSASWGRTRIREAESG